MKYALSLLFLTILTINSLQAQLFFGPSITHTSTREWNKSSDEYTTNDFNFSFYYQVNKTTSTKFSINNIIRQGGNRSTEFLRFPALIEITVEDFVINDQQLWRLYFATGGYFALPVNSDTDESWIDYYSFGAIGEIGMAFNFSSGAFAVIGYRGSVDFDAIKRNDSAIPQRFADSGIQLGFFMPFSIFSKKGWSKE